MDMNKSIVFTLFIVFTGILFAQPQAEIQAIRDQSDIYYFGYAEGQNRAETNQRALHELMSQISVVVFSDLRVSGKDDGDISQETVEKRVQTFACGRLPGVSQLDYRTGNTFHILRYIEKQKYTEIFSCRKREIEGFLREADTNLDHNELGNVFRNYYRAALAIESLPEGSVEIGGRAYTPQILFYRIRDIADKIDFRLVSNQFDIDTRTIVLEPTYKGRPVNGLTIMVYDLVHYIPYTTNQGRFAVELYGPDYERMDVLEVKIDIREGYCDAYEEQTRVLDQLLKSKDVAVLRKIPLTRKRLETKPVTLKKSTASESLNEFTTLKNIEVKNPSDCPDATVKALLGNLDRLMYQFEDQQITARELFTDDDAFKRAEALCRENRLALAPLDQSAKIDRTDVGYELRALSVSVQCKDLPVRTESLVIDFDDQGRIYNLSYTINPDLYDCFHKAGENTKDWEYRKIGIKFMENYRTAFGTKDLDAVANLFTEDALIITGKVVQRTPNEIRMKSEVPAADVQYFRQTKREYVGRLREVFQTNPTVWLQFDTFNIRGSTVDSVYGMAMKQNYFSTNYKDEGYLFLLVDFRNEKPMIHVRVWQPGEWDLDKMANTELFQLN